MTNTINLGQLYLNLADDTSKISAMSKTVLHRFYEYVIEDIGRGLTIVPTDKNYSYQEMEAMYQRQFLPIFAGGSDGSLGIPKLTERAAHEIIHMITGNDFTSSGEYKVCLDTLRLFDSFVKYKFNYISETVSHQCKQIIYSEVHLQSCAYHYLGEFPDTQKIVLTHLPRYEREFLNWSSLDKKLVRSKK